MAKGTLKECTQVKEDKKTDAGSGESFSGNGPMNKNSRPGHWRPEAGQRALGIPVGSGAEARDPASSLTFSPLGPASPRRPGSPGGPCGETGEVTFLRGGSKFNFYSLPDSSQSRGPTHPYSQSLTTGPGGPAWPVAPGRPCWPYRLERTPQGWRMHTSHTAHGWHPPPQSLHTATHH